MVLPLPTSDARPFLFHRLLTSFKYIIWIALACIAEVPILVGVFLPLDNTVLTVFRSSSFSIRMVCLELADTRLKLTDLSALIDAWNEVCHHSIA